MDAPMKSQLDFTDLSPTIELLDYYHSISRKISSIDRTLDQCGRKSVDLLRERDLLVNAQNLIDACLDGADVPIWAEFDRVRHLIDKGVQNG